MAHLSHASWSLFWDDRRKCWFLSERSEVGPSRTIKLDTTVPLAREEVHIISAEIIKAVFGFLHG